MKAHYLLGLVLLASCGHKQQETPAEIPTPAEVLIARLQTVTDSGKYIFGHADDTAYGRTWAYESGRSDVKETVGDYPGLINWDLGMIELDSAKNLDGVPFDYMAAEIAAQNARGGINSISWHLRNPVTGGDAWDVSEATTVAQCEADSSAYRQILTEWIGKTADFIGKSISEYGIFVRIGFHSGEIFRIGVHRIFPRYSEKSS